MTRQWNTLTPSETEVALLVAEGLANQQIARLRQCSVRTVESHVRQVLDKLSLGSRTGVLPWLIAADLAHLTETIREGTT
jgi:DNA-binding CsgD family transcriptional regulator